MSEPVLTPEQQEQVRASIREQFGKIMPPAPTVSADLADLDADGVLALPKTEYHSLLRNPANEDFIIKKLKEKWSTMDGVDVNTVDPDVLDRLFDVKEIAQAAQKRLLSLYSAQAAAKEKAPIEVMSAEEQAVAEAEEAAAFAAEAEAAAARITAPGAPAEQIVIIEPALVAEKAEADRVAAEAEAKVAADKAAADEAARVAALPKTKIVREYQLRDEDGNPIGNPTHLEADTWEEMSQKQVEVHEQAMRYAKRQQKKKENLERIRATAQPQILTIQPPSAEEIQKATADLESDDLKVRVSAIHTLSARDRAEAQRATQMAIGEAESFKFLQNHINDFNRCKANIDLFAAYTRDNKLAWTADNLELAFEDLQDKLAPVVRANPAPIAQPSVPVAPKQEPVAANPAPAPAPVVAAAPAAVVPTPIVPPVVAPNAPAPVRKPSAGGIEPGTLHGARPGRRIVPEITMADVNALSGPEFKKWMKDPVRRAQLTKLGVKL